MTAEEAHLFGLHSKPDDICSICAQIAKIRVLREERDTLKKVLEKRSIAMKTAMDMLESEDEHREIFFVLQDGFDEEDNEDSKRDSVDTTFEKEDNQ